MYFPASLGILDNAKLCSTLTTPSYVVPSQTFPLLYINIYITNIVYAKGYLTSPLRYTPFRKQGPPNFFTPDHFCPKNLLTPIISDPNFWFPFYLSVSI